jgi:hypothetical protein
MEPTFLTFSIGYEQVHFHTLPLSSFKGHLPKLSYDTKVNLLEEARYYSLDSLILLLEEDLDNNKEANKITQKEFIKLVTRY